MLMDKITETIAHFIGLFEVTVEQARVRDAYLEFKAQQTLEPEDPQLLIVDVDGKAPYTFVGFDPRIPYQPLPPELVWARAGTHVSFQPPEVANIELRATVVDPGLPPAFAATGVATPQTEIDPPGSVAAYILQKIGLTDNDYVGAAGPGFLFAPQMDHGAAMAALWGASMELRLFGQETPPGSSETIADFIIASTDELRAFDAQRTADAEIFVSKASSIDGIFVDGQAVDELPRLDDHLPAQETEADASEEPATNAFDYGGKSGNTVPSAVEVAANGSVAEGAGTAAIDASVELTAGGNTLVNSAFLTNNWLAAPVFVVLNDHWEINAISQINAWSGTDLVTSAIGGWAHDGSATEAFNIALFDRLDPSTSDGPSAGNGGFPQHWTITEITGDVIIMNWVEQFTFVMDNDVAILSSSGVKTNIIAGANMAINDTSLDELGLYYDLIIVGGSIYDANLIQQINLVLDNDIVGALSGFQTHGEGTLSTDGNLLWNQAGIVNVGGADRFSALPDHYRASADAIAQGDKTLSAEVLSDSAFAGLTGIRVLYISGDILNLQYVSQTNVLGDNDQVALAMNGLASDSDWTISTGANAAINLAGIVDVDATGKTYVGGGVYSDELLIQAELVSADPILARQDPDVLVSEAVAFLGDDMLVPNSVGQPDGAGFVAPDGAYADPMQTILS